MRVIESAGFYYPDWIGGTEVYVSSLLKELQVQGIECSVAAPARIERSRSIRPRRFRCVPLSSPNVLASARR